MDGWVDGWVAGWNEGWVGGAVGIKAPSKISLSEANFILPRSQTSL